MELWRTHKNWDYFNLDLDEQPDQFPEFVELNDLWQSKRTGDNLPTWSDFDFREFAGWHASLILWDVLHDPFDLKYRLFGTKVAEVYGKDLTGKTVRGLGFEVDDEIDFLHIEVIYKNRYKGFGVGPMHWNNREYKYVAFMDFPLANSEGDISQFISAMAIQPDVFLGEHP